MIIGQPIECITTAVNEGSRTVTVRAHKKAVYEGVTRGSQLTFNSLNAGMLFNVVVDKIVEVCVI